jgi:hypothetical protein
MIGLVPVWQYSSVMAVTETEHKTGRSSQDEDSQRREEREDKRQPESRAHEEPNSGAEDSDSSESKQPEKRKRVKGLAGGIGIFLILAIYFVWIGSEMGSHAISGTFEMWAIFGAIFLGVLALLAGGAISRRRND